MGCAMRWEGRLHRRHGSAPYGNGNLRGVPATGCRGRRKPVTPGARRRREGHPHRHSARSGREPADGSHHQLDVRQPGDCHRLAGGRGHGTRRRLHVRNCDERRPTIVRESRGTVQVLSCLEHECRRRSYLRVQDFRGHALLGQPWQRQVR